MFIGGALLLAFPSLHPEEILQKKKIDKRDVTTSGMKLISVGFAFQLIGQFVPLYF
jgi:hypothetical protein